MSACPGQVVFANELENEMTEMKALTEIIAGLDLISDMATFDPEKTFRDNDIDSLDVMSVFLAVEEHFGIKFPEEEALQINTPSQLLNAINERG